MPYPKPIRGGFLVEDLNGTDQEKARRPFIFIPFLFNPEPIDETESNNFASNPIPGRADPFRQYTGGDGSSLSFDLIVDLERIAELQNYLTTTNYVGEEISQAEADVRANRSINKFSSFTLSDEEIENMQTFLPDDADLYIEQIRKFMLPRQSSDWINKAPPSVTFLFGASTYKGKFQDFSVVKYLFTPELKTKYAEISITLIKDNPPFPRTFNNFPINAAKIRLPFDQNELNNLSVTSNQRGYVTR